LKKNLQESLYCWSVSYVTH